MRLNKKTIFASLVLLIVCGTLFTIFSYPGKYLKARITGGAVDSYMACGCGGCGGVGSSEKVIYNKEEFDNIKQQDQALKKSTNCKYMGCSFCTKYILKV